jgi:hypothetical protein
MKRTTGACIYLFIFISCCGYAQNDSLNKNGKWTADLGLSISAVTSKQMQGALSEYGKSVRNYSTKYSQVTSELSLLFLLTHNKTLVKNELAITGIRISQSFDGLYVHSNPNYSAMAHYSQNYRYTVLNYKLLFGKRLTKGLEMLAGMQFGYIVDAEEKFFPANFYGETIYTWSGAEILSICFETNYFFTKKIFFGVKTSQQFFGDNSIEVSKRDRINSIYITGGILF